MTWFYFAYPAGASLRSPSASRSLLQRHKLYACPAGASFCTAKRRQKRVKGDRFPLDEPLSVACSAGYERCKSIVRTAHRYAPKVAAGASAPSALRCPKKSSRYSLARFFRPLRVLRLAASATGGARLRTPYPSPVAGKGPSGQIAACSTHRLDSVTSCNRFAGTKLKCACGSLSASSNPAPGMRSVSGREGSDA